MQKPIIPKPVVKEEEEEDDFDFLKEHKTKADKEKDSKVLTEVQDKKQENQEGKKGEEE